MTPVNTCLTVSGNRWMSRHWRKRSGRDNGQNNGFGRAEIANKLCGPQWSCYTVAAAAGALSQTARLTLARLKPFRVRSSALIQGLLGIELTQITQFICHLSDLLVSLFFCPFALDSWRRLICQDVVVGCVGPSRSWRGRPS